MISKKGVWLDNLEGKQLIVKSNELIQASYKLTLQEARVILLLTSMIKRDDDDFKLYRIKVKDFAKFAGIEKNKNIYKQLFNLTKKLRKRDISIAKNDGRIMDIGWLSSSEYYSREGFVELEFSPKLKPYLLQLKERFTKYQLNNILKIKSFSGIRIYEFLKQWEKLKTKTIEISDLREVLGISKEKYKLYGDFKRRILKPAQKEISEKTDISFNLTEIKKGRKVVMLRFNIKPKKIIGPEIPEPPKVEKIKSTNLYQRLIDYFCVNAKDAIKVLNKHPESQILENLAYVEHQHNKGKIQNLGPYTLKAIKDDYKLQLSLFDKEKEVEKRKNQQKDEEQQKQNNLKRLYVEYRRNKIDEFKKSILPDDLKKLQAQCKEGVIKKRGENQIGFAGFVRIEFENCVAERENILKFDEWAAEHKN